MHETIRQTTYRRSPQAKLSFTDHVHEFDMSQEERAARTTFISTTCPSLGYKHMELNDEATPHNSFVEANN